MHNDENFQKDEVNSIQISGMALRNRLISAGLGPVLSHTDKSCIASYFRQFFTNIIISIIKLIPG